MRISHVLGQTVLVLVGAATHITLPLIYFVHSLRVAVQEDVRGESLSTFWARTL